MGGKGREGGKSGEVREGMERRYRQSKERGGKGREGEERKRNRQEKGVELEDGSPEVVKQGVGHLTGIVGGSSIAP